MGWNVDIQPFGWKCNAQCVIAQKHIQIASFSVVCHLGHRDCTQMRWDLADQPRNIYNIKHWPWSPRSHAIYQNKLCLHKFQARYKYDLGHQAPKTKTFPSRKYVFLSDGDFKTYKNCWLKRLSGPISFRSRQRRRYCFLTLQCRVQSHSRRTRHTNYGVYWRRDTRKIGLRQHPWFKKTLPSRASFYQFCHTKRDRRQPAGRKRIFSALTVGYIRKRHSIWYFVRWPDHDSKNEVREPANCFFKNVTENVLVMVKSGKSTVLMIRCANQIYSLHKTLTPNRHCLI